jgi:hypothetical protein
MDEMVLVVAIISLSALSIMLLWGLMMYYLKARRLEKQMVSNPYQMMRDIFSNDRHWSGIPDNMERMFRRMEEEMKGRGPEYDDGRGWGFTETTVNGRTVRREWGNPPDETEEAFLRTFRDYMDGRISKREFQKEIRKFMKKRTWK